MKRTERPIPCPKCGEPLRHRALSGLRWCANVNCADYKGRPPINYQPKVDTHLVQVFSEKAGYPRFKPRDRFNSFTFPAWGDGVHITEQGRLKVQGVGVIKLKVHRPHHEDYPEYIYTFVNPEGKEVQITASNAELATLRAWDQDITLSLKGYVGIYRKE